MTCRVPRASSRPRPRRRAPLPSSSASCVVKAQVKAGGRGKAGGVKLAKTPDEAEAHAEAILGMEIKGLTVHRVLIAPAASIEEEYYFSFLLDRANRQYLCIASVEGGVEIEEVAKTNPDAVKQIAIDPGTGVDEAKAREIVAEAGFPEVLTEQAVADGAERCGRSSSRRTPPSSRSTRWPAWPATSSRRSTARSRSTRTPSSATRTTPSSRTRRPPTRSRRRPRPRASTTSSSTATSASSATARAW